MDATGPPGPTGTHPLELLEAAQGGDPDAVSTLYRAEHPQVFRLCLGFLADATEAEDAAQDAMLKLLDRLDAYDRARSWRAWRNTVVLNLCRDRLRRSSARRRAEDVAGEWPHRPLPSPEELARRAEVNELVTRALAVLTPREREVFVLRDLQGESSADAAEALGVAVPTVRSMLTLARRRLRSVLGPQLVGASPRAAADPGGAR